MVSAEVFQLFPCLLETYWPRKLVTYNLVTYNLVTYNLVTYNLVTYNLVT